MKKIYLITFILFISSFQLFAADSTYVAFAGTEIANGYYTVIDSLNNQPLFSSGICEIGYYDDDDKAGGEEWLWGLFEGTIASSNRLYYAEPDSMNGTEIPIIDDWEVGYSSEAPAPVVYFGEYLLAQGMIFNEISINSGMIDNSKPVIIKHNNFKGYGFAGNDGEDFYLNSKALVSNIPTGLTPSIIRVDSVTLSITMNGVATSHNNSDDIAMTLNFRNSAFTSGDVASVMKNTTDIIVNFCQEYLVAPSGGDYTNIYDAVNSGGYVYGGGDVINVAPGTYIEPSEIIIEKGLTINGSSKDNTIIQVADPGITQQRLFTTYRYFEREDDLFIVNINDLSLKGGDISNLVSHEESIGGGIFVDRDVTLNLNDAIVSGSIANNGGGIYSGGDMLLNNVSIRNNSAKSGGGIYLNGTTTKISNSTISYNSTFAWSGAGIMSSGTLELTNSTISDNTSFDNGGGINCGSSGNIMITNCTVSNNSSGSEGGGIWTNFGKITASNTIITGNYANSVNSDYHALYGVTLNDNGYNCVGYQIVSGTPSDWNFSHPDNILFNLQADGSVSTEWTMNDIVLTNQTLGLDSILAENDTNNGTQTIAILDGSFLIDAGTDQPNGPINIPEQDQRGFNRFENVDIGAYEFMSLYYPENVTAISDGSSVTLTWDVVDGALSYNIYASVNPYSNFQDLTDFGDFNSDTSWTIPYADKKLFLYVISSSEERKSVKIENVTSEMILEYLTKEIDARD